MCCPTKQSEVAQKLSIAIGGLHDDKLCDILQPTKVKSGSSNLLTPCREQLRSTRIYECLYNDNFQQSVDQLSKVANPARRQLNRENETRQVRCRRDSRTRLARLNFQMRTGKNVISLFKREWASQSNTVN